MIEIFFYIKNILEKPSYFFIENKNNCHAGTKLEDRITSLIATFAHLEGNPPKVQT